MRYTQEQIEKIFNDAVELFNNTMNTEYAVKTIPESTNDIMLRFFTPETGEEVYEAFCSKYFLRHLKDDHSGIEPFIDTAAQAFVSELYNGVMIRADIYEPEYELLRIFTHEIGHLFCVRYEIDDGNFYSKYCDDPNHPIYGENVSRQMNGCIVAGYTIWREAIADILSVESCMPVLGFGSHTKQIKQLYNDIYFGNPYAKRETSLIIVYVAYSVKSARDIRKKYAYMNNDMLDLLETVYEHLKNDKFYRITDGFIAEIGSLYLFSLIHK